MLSNLETEKSKLMQIVLAGQPVLSPDALASPWLEQLRQRVTVRFHLDPLTAEETARYINHRLRMAAIDTPLQLSRAMHRRHPQPHPRCAADDQRGHRCPAAGRRTARISAASA